MHIVVPLGVNLSIQKVLKYNTFIFKIAILSGLRFYTTQTTIGTVTPVSNIIFHLL